MTTMVECRLSPPTYKDQQHRINQSFLSATTHPTHLGHLLSLSTPAYTEACLVACHSDAFVATLNRLYEGAMDVESGPSVKRAPSRQRTPSRQPSRNNLRSKRSQSLRPNGRSHIASSASSIAESDKSLTSFPSFSPGSLEAERILELPAGHNGNVHIPRNASIVAPSIVESLTSTSPSNENRSALFDDTPITASKVPGSLHHANNEHIERLIARSGAVALVRQVAEDLAQRDAQIATLRRKAEERERALRKIVLECGLSNLDLERRLREIEVTARKEQAEKLAMGADTPLEDLINTAMSDVIDVDTPKADRNTTIRAADVATNDSKQTKGTSKPWTNFIWGSSRPSSRSSSICNATVDSSVAILSKTEPRKSVLSKDVFQPQETGSPHSPSRASSIASKPPPLQRQISNTFAALALKLVAGTARPDEPSSPRRGRASSITDKAGNRAASSASAKTSTPSKNVPVNPHDVHSRRKTVAIPTMPPLNSRTAQERWDTMGPSPQGAPSGLPENFGPVEMDAILPPETQPPTISQAYNNRYNPEFLTDRFGFIYDQRRKKRQKQASESVKKTKGRSRIEMLSGSRGGMSPDETESDLVAESVDERPDTPSTDEGDKTVKKWQDYLKIATFPTELLSHTPSGSVPTMEVLEGESAPTSPGITTEERGFVPSATTTTQPHISGFGVSDNATISRPVMTLTTNALSKEDVEPVKILLEQLGDVHDSLQRDKTVRWNDFLRKVRAERRREGQAAVAAMASATETRSQRKMASMPEVSMADGEMIGVAGMGVKGKVGRAKWVEFKSLVLSGIPVAYRAKIWAECSGASANRIPGYYDDLVASRTGEDDPVIVAQIQMDINRTLTDNIFFRRGPGVSKLNEVLLAYSRRNAEVGYCQGMNLITACLLLVMPTAEDAFWVLCSIIENILPRGYYDHSLLASRADQQVLRQYVSEVLPKLSLHLDELGIELEALTFQWFLSVFTDCLSAEALFRVWDVVFCINDGSTFLFQVALALLKLNEQQLLKCDTPAGIYTYINHQMTNHAISIDGLIHASEGLRKVVKREDVESRRTKAIENEKDLIRQREARNNLKKAEKARTAELEIVDEVDVGESGLGESRRSSQVDGLEDGEYGELTVRTPMPIEEEAVLSLG